LLPPAAAAPPGTKIDGVPEPLGWTCSDFVARNSLGWTWAGRVTVASTLRGACAVEISSPSAAGASAAAGTDGGGGAGTASGLSAPSAPDWRHAHDAAASEKATILAVSFDVFMMWVLQVIVF
jgi:hypothetical protein